MLSYQAATASHSFSNRSRDGASIHGLMRVRFIFPRTGHIWKDPGALSKVRREREMYSDETCQDVTHRALPLRIFATWSSLTFEVLFYALIASLLFTELWEIYGVVRKVRKNRPLLCRRVQASWIQINSFPCALFRPIALAAFRPSRERTQISQAHLHWQRLL